MFNASRSSLSHSSLLLLGSPLLTPSITLAVQAADEIVVADFEANDYGKWTATGEAFGPRPARGTLPGQMQVDGFQGQGLVNSFHGGDDYRHTHFEHVSYRTQVHQVPHRWRQNEASSRYSYW